LQEWDIKNPKYANRSIEDKDRVYKNQKYVEKYGKEMFFSKTSKQRDA